MQETGNKNIISDKVLSVRLTAGGLSFSVLPAGKDEREHFLAYLKDAKKVDSLRQMFTKVRELGGATYATVQVLLDTPDTVFVPAKLLESMPPENFLYEGGIFPGADKVTLVSPEVDNLCAVMSFDREVIGFFVERFGDNVIWFSPLQENLEVRERVNLSEGGYVVNITEGNLYVSSFNSNGQLLVAEVYPYSSEADIVYYLYKLTEYSAAKKDRIFLYGGRAAQHTRIVKKYFSRASLV